MLNKNTTILTKGLMSEFLRKRLAMDNPVVDLICMRVQSNNRSETYAWLGDVPQVKEWLGGRKFTVLSDATYTITNKDWEVSLAFDRNDFRDDQTGGIVIRIREIAARAANHPVSLITTALVNGTSATLGLGYDGVAFFHDAHPVRGDLSATQDNLLAGTGVTAAALQTDLNSSISAMRRFKDEANEPFADDFDSLLVVSPPELELVWRTALFAAVISQTSNVFASRADLWITSRLADTNDWYLLNVGNEVKPLIFQEREPLTVESVLQGEGEFMTRTLLFGACARYAMGYGFWQYAVKMVN